ncbi:hypothetical protein RJT34_14133 [Clitoria ternatea]|uniref:Uncharacterized protein n=1 Tax=Clitoria ternatea TaxID=43366 RepID=A0AAN9PM47_CLITE
MQHRHLLIPALHHNLIQVELQVRGFCEIQKFMFLLNPKFPFQSTCSTPQFRDSYSFCEITKHFPFSYASIYSFPLVAFVIIAGTDPRRLVFSAVS